MSFFDGKLLIESASASGIEAVTKRELFKLGYNPSGAEYGRITYEGTFLDVVRSNIFLRTSNRIRIVISTFTATTFDELYDSIYSIPWQEIITKDGTIVVDAKSIKSTLFALSSIQSISKKAIVSKLCSYHSLNSLSESGSIYNIEVSLINDVCRVTLDTSGDGLHKRGYRTLVGHAPMRETMAAAIIELSVWNPDRVLIDPFCGSGTFPIEAALIALNIAPGLHRSFSFENWVNAPSLRDIVTEEAKDLETLDKELRISGFDIDPAQVKLALKHAENAGVKDKIHIQAQDMRKLSSRFSHGVIITNPPYGERLLQEAELKELYRDFGKVFSSLDEWCAYVITSYKGFEKYFGKKADKTRKLYNSELECNLYQYLGKPPRKEEK